MSPLSRKKRRNARTAKLCFVKARPGSDAGLFLLFGFVAASVDPAIRASRGNAPGRCLIIRQSVTLPAKLHRLALN
jgi:hypothetical protein